MPEGNVKRRDFMMGALATTTAVAQGMPDSHAVTKGGRVLGANDRIQVGVIGVGNRGSHLAGQFAAIGNRTNGCQIVAVCDTYQKRVTANKEARKCDGYLDYREVIARKDIDAVIVATPDHWHARIALEALETGKDVYLEKPMSHTIEQAKELIRVVKETGRVVQVGSQTCSAAHWWKTRELVNEGAIGQLVMSQGSYHRNAVRSWLDAPSPIDPQAGPHAKGDDYVDWNMWLGPAPKRPWNADRFFRFRKYWDYSGGIATDLFFHIGAPLNICWGEAQFPRKVTAAGGYFAFPGEVRGDVPDTFHLLAEYPKGHSMVLSSTMANSVHEPGSIRGHMGTITMVDHGGFERATDHILLRPEEPVIDGAYRTKFGQTETRVPIEVPNERKDWETAHFTNFLDCMRSRKPPRLDVETAARTQVLVSMSVQSFREARVLFFDEKTWKVNDRPLRES